MARKEVYGDENNSPIGPDEGPMRMAAGKMGLTTAPSDAYSNTCIGELNEDANPHIIERSQERVPVRPCPGQPDDILCGYVTKVPSSQLRPTYRPHQTER